MTDAYADTAVSIKHAPDGSVLSCASVPGMVALMLDQLDVHPGQRVLEIGAGTGYNAALLGELVGPSGHVSTVDLEPDITAHARRALEATGYDRVRVRTQDGVLGDAEHGPYDRIIVTVGAWDIPPAWWQQLRIGGRLVLPLRWRGQTRTIAFTHQGDRLVSDSVQLCGFVPMVGQAGEVTGHLDPEGLVALYWDVDQPIDLTLLQGVLSTPRIEEWSQVILGRNVPFDGVWLRLTTAEAGICRIAASPAAIEAGLCRPAGGPHSPALVERDSLAYFTYRRLPDDDSEGRWELGAIGHGPAGHRLTARLCDQIRIWNQDRAAQPVITAHPTGQATTRPTIGKPHCTLVIDF